jgi:hypothetical protein
MVDNFRTMIEDCCAWNRKTWADAVEFAVSQLPERLDDKKFLRLAPESIQVFRRFRK